MITEYLNCNVFVCPSSIENSPNSLGEAQILGVPCIGSYAGGIPDMMIGLESYLFRFDDIDMLSYLLCRVFEEKNNNNLNCITIAEARHDPIKNNNVLLDIYRNIGTLE